MIVRAVRGAIQLERDEPAHLLESVEQLVEQVMEANQLHARDLISMMFTATPDLLSAFPAAAARRLGLVDVPLMCAQELDIVGALPRTVRLLVHAESDRPRAEIRHIYLGGAAVLRTDLAGPANDSDTAQPDPMPQSKEGVTP
ncbi:chorismate mutase [Streptomyces sp. SID4917]|nr:chorismate mutase [Streptomyces sp. SID4917]SCG07330.1 chorismate mutase [Streptomyces sp. MnatMP-M17]